MGTVLLSVLSGHQQGADIGYNPQKPDRPSHVYHSYLVANLRISPGVEVRPCNEHSAAKGLPGLWRTLEKLPHHQWPTYEQAFPTQVIPKHYRDRADAENCFDELKNQWGWNGYTSRRLASSRLMANLVALIYNWWNLYLRFYDEEHHREAIHTRPMLMSGVGR